MLRVHGHKTENIAGLLDTISFPKSLSLQGFLVAAYIPKIFFYRCVCDEAQVVLPLGEYSLHTQIGSILSTDDTQIPNRPYCHQPDEESDDVVGVYVLSKP